MCLNLAARRGLLDEKVDGMIRVDDWTGLHAGDPSCFAKRESINSWIGAPHWTIWSEPHGCQE